MKKKLESDLISIAHRILKLKGKEDVNKLYTEVSELYEKLSVLKFAQENFEDDMPTIGSDTSFLTLWKKRLIIRLAILWRLKIKFMLM